MGLNGHKKVGVGVGIVAVFGAIATVIGFYSDIKDIFSKKDDKTQEVVVTSIVTQEETQAQVVEETTTELVTTTEETITELVTTTIPRNPEELYLHNIEPTQSKDFVNKDSLTDTIGNQYIGNVQMITQNGYAIYYIGGKYSRLIGTVAARDREDCFNNDNISTVSISLDDVEVYNTGEFTRISTPMSVDIDITNAQWLKIQHSKTSGYGDVILANFKFVE